MYSPTDNKTDCAPIRWRLIAAVCLLAAIPVLITSDTLRANSSPPSVAPDSLQKILPAGPRLVKNWPINLSNSINYAPAVADIDGDGRDELAVGVKDCRVYLLDWQGKSLPGWPCETAAEISRGPMMEDLDGDGDYEIAAGTNDGLMHMWREGGSVVDGWPVDLGGRAVSSPIPVVSDRAEGKSILIAARLPEAGAVYLLSPEGKNRDGWPKILPHNIAAASFDRRPLWAADLDRDGTMEIVCLTTNPPVVYAWYQDGAGFPGFPVTMGDKSGLGMAIDDNSDPGYIAVSNGTEVILRDLRTGSEISMSHGRDKTSFLTGPYFISSGNGPEAKADRILIGTLDGYVFIWDLGGRPCEGWPILLDGFIYGLVQEDEGHMVYGPPIMADVDGDSIDEIILGSRNHHLYCFELDGTPVPGWPVVLDDFIYNSLILAQLDGKGAKELVVGQAGETLFAWHINPLEPLSDTDMRLDSHTYSEWPSIYYAVVLVILLMLLLLMHLLRKELIGYSDSPGNRIRGALFLLVLFLVVRVLFFASDLYRYTATMDRLERAEPDVMTILESEHEKAVKLADDLAADLRSCDIASLKDQHRSLRCLERLADRNRLEYRFSGVLLADQSGHVIRGIGLGRGWSHLSEMGLAKGDPGGPLLLGDIPVFATEAGSGLVVAQDTLRLFLLTSLLNKVPNALADNIGFSAHVRVYGKTMAWGGAGQRPYRSLRPWLGIIQPSREMTITSSGRQQGLTVLLADEDFDKSFSQWLDLIAVLILPCIYLLIVTLQRDRERARLKFWWIITFGSLYVICALLLHRGMLDTGPISAAGRALEVLLHMTGVTGVVVALHRIVTSRRSRRLNFALLGSYLFVSLIPLSVIMFVGGNLFLDVQRGIVEKTIERLEKRADNMVLSYMGNPSFNMLLSEEGDNLLDLSTETSWLNFVGEDEYLFTYDMPDAYITIWARDRKDSSRYFTGYSYMAPRTGKLYDTRPGWTRDENVKGLFLDNGTAVIRAMRLYRHKSYEMDIVSHIPINDRIISEMEEELRILSVFPRIHLEPAWLESSIDRSRPEGWYMPYSSELVLQARGWQSGKPRWAVYRASMYIQTGREMFSFLIPVILLVLLPLSLSLWGAYTTFKRTARPLTRLLTGIRKVGEGNLDYRLGESGQSEIGVAARSFDKMAGSLQEMIGELAEKQNVEAVSEMKSNFISMVSHDLKTPLASIRGAAENVLEEVVGPVTERQRTYLDMILKSSGDLQRMITDLLDLSRIESGRLQLNVEPFDIRREIEDLLSSITPILEKEKMKGLLTVRTEGTIVRGDRTRIWQVLNNIISNAIRYSPEGGTIEIRLDDIPTDETNGQRMLLVSVRDEGPGISEEGAEKLFEPFFYRSSGLTGAHGAGLGLAIVKQLVELHGGIVSIRNAEAGGTVFSFTLPG